MVHTGKKRGRPSRPYRASWGENIDGLYRKPDGRWRINATGQHFTEHDERVAVARFRQWQQADGRKVVTMALPSQDYESTMPVLMTGSASMTMPARMPNNNRMSADLVKDLADLGIKVEADDDDGPPQPQKVQVKRVPVIGIDVPEEIIWPWLRVQLLERPEVVAEKVAIPQLASLATMALPRESVRLSRLADLYQTHADVKPVTKNKVDGTWGEFVKLTGAKTLRDLTTEKLTAYRDAIKKRLGGAATVSAYFQRVKGVIRFGLSHGLDPVEVRSALDRCAVLVAPKRKQEYSPTPISRDHFAKLIDVADDLQRAALLLSMNACLYVSEVLAVDWDELDLNAGTFVTRRGKTSVIRAAVLWPRTVKALKALKVTPGAVFKSARGDRYHPNSFRKVFGKLRTAAKVPALIEYNHIRDGAYTAACASGAEFSLCQIVAGHRLPGESDHYVARNPKMVAPVCEAIERAYFGKLAKR
jgi:integrase